MKGNTLTPQIKCSVYVMYISDVALLGVLQLPNYVCNNFPMECGTTFQLCNNFSVEFGTTSHWNASNPHVKCKLGIVVGTGILNSLPTVH